MLFNLVLIPRFGIVGAAAASLVSYTLTSITLTVLTSRQTGIRAIDFWVPRVSDVRYLIVMTAEIVRRYTGRRAAAADSHDA